MKLVPKKIAIFFSNTDIRNLKRELQVQYPVFEAYDWECNIACSIDIKEEVQKELLEREVEIKRTKETMYFDVRDLKEYTFYKIKFRYKKVIQKIRTGSSFGEDGCKMDYSYIKKGRIGIPLRYINPYEVEYIEEITEEEAKSFKESSKRKVSENKDFNIGDFVEIYWEQQNKNETKAHIINYDEKTGYILYLCFHPHKRKYIYTKDSNLKYIKGIRILKGVELDKFKQRVSRFMGNVIKNQNHKMDMKYVFDYYKIKVSYDVEKNQFKLEKKDKDALIIQFKEQTRKGKLNEILSLHLQEIENYSEGLSGYDVWRYLEKYEFNKIRKLL